MATVGKQISNARKAREMTQDELAEAMNVSRSSISNWEIGRRLPDAETLLRLSSVLSYRFEAEGEGEPLSDSALPSESDTQASAESDSPASSETGCAEAAERSLSADENTSKEVLNSIPASQFRKIRTWIIVAASMMLVCIVLIFIIVLSKPDGKTKTYTSPEGVIYTVDELQTPAENDLEKAYLRIEPQLTILTQGDGRDYWMYAFRSFEMNGYAVHLNRVELIYFTADGHENSVQILTSADLEAMNVDTNISPNGESVLSGGLPIQNSVRGIGFLIRCTDENGKALSFSAYIPLAV